MFAIVDVVFFVVSMKFVTIVIIIAAHVLLRFQFAVFFAVALSIANGVVYVVVVVSVDIDFVMMVPHFAMFHSQQQKLLLTVHTSWFIDIAGVDESV